ncbi:TPR repeat-containing thioredoxin TDX-like isoform X2 [Camellia sinensis]|uniref:TPR repeat-containing thioredoxin TDX-like isoform X2 n=1 Tax=Camellia sinensis TaxID=4442 RepID=UPI00103629A7|nr:TPR repeat-containing thioredoxin TDX-like isoform X2 [Camellia sinensis]
MEENRDASKEAKVQGKLEEAIEQLTQAILLNPTSAIMYSGSFIAIVSAEVFFEECYHASWFVKVHVCGQNLRVFLCWQVYWRLMSG